MGHFLLFLASLLKIQQLNLSAHRFTPWLKCAACPGVLVIPWGNCQTLNWGSQKNTAKQEKNLRITHTKMQKSAAAETELP